MDDVLALAYPAGTGKTHAVVRGVNAAVARGKRVAFYGPTVAQNVEVAEKIGSVARVVRGRNQPNPDIAGQRMCQRADVARAVGELGHSVGRTLCPECPFKAECSYLAQFIDPPAVLLFSHAYLTIPRRPGCEADYAVIDEAFWQGCIEVRELPFASLAQAFPPGFAPLWGALVTGWQGGAVLASLQALPGSAGQLEAASLLVFQGTTHPKFGPTATAADVKRRTGGGRNAPVVARILRSLAEEMISAPKRAISHTVRLVDDTLQLSFLKELCALDGVDRVLVIDAQANKDILERVMPGRSIHYERKDAIRNADVVQITDSVNGVGRLENNPELVDTGVRFAEWIGSENASLTFKDTIQKTAMFMPKTIRHNLTAESKDGGTLPVSYAFGGVDVGHYGNVKGSNIFEHHQSAVLIGRSQTPAPVLERFSGLFKHDTEPLQFAGQCVRQDRGYCHPSGRGASVWVHPDPRLQSLLEQSREWECIQALDRLRLYGDIRKSVYIFTDLVLPIHVSRFATERETIPDWRDLAVQNGGIILDSASWLAKAFPARFGAASVAKEWLKGGGWQNGGAAYNMSIGSTPVLPPKAACVPDPLTPTVVQHRPKPIRASRAGGFKRALHVGNPGDIPADLNKATGKPTEFIAYLFGGAAIMTNAPMPTQSVVRDSEEK